MLVEFAISPDLFDPVYIECVEDYGVELRHLLQAIAADGVIADLDGGNWSRRVGELLKSPEFELGAKVDPQRDRRTSEVRALLGRLFDSKCLAKHPAKANGPASCAADWQLLINARNRTARLDHVIHDPCANAFAFDQTRMSESVHEVNTSPDWPPISPVMTTTAEKDLAPRIDRLIRHPRSIVVIDPWLRISDAGTLKLLETLVAKGGWMRPDLGLLQIWINVADDGKDADATVMHWSSAVSKFSRDFKRIAKVTLTAWKKIGLSKDPHDRSILTESSGMWSGRGWSMASPGKGFETDIGLLDRRELSRRHDRWTPALNGDLIAWSRSIS